MTRTPTYPALVHPGQAWPGQPTARPPLLPPLAPGDPVAADPWLPDSPDVIRESHRQVVRVTATPPDYTGDLPLDLIDGSVSFDERRAPRVEANLTAALNVDPRLLDPRAGARVTIEAGYSRPDVEDVHVLAELGVRRVVVSRPDNTLPLTASGDEARVIDASPLVAGTVSGPAEDAMRDLIKGALHPNPRIRATVTGPAVTVDPVTDRWETLDDLADRHGWDVYDTGAGEWIIEDRPTLAEPVLALTVGQAGTVERDESSWDRDGWANYVTLVYRWRDEADVDHEVRATALIDDDYSPYRITGPAGKVAYLEERDVPTTQGEANAAAAAVLARMMSRSRSHSLTSPAAYWLRPGMTVTVTPSGEEPQDHLVARVTFNLTAGTMDVDTRLPEPAVITTTTPTGGTGEPTPEPEPDPEPPAKQRYRTVWTANASETYRGDGTPRTDTGNLVQGYNRYNGNGSGIALFTAGATAGDEQGQTLDAALAGADITKIEVWLYLDHSWYNAGGTARIGYYDGASLPSSYSGASPYITVDGWRPRSGRWVNISGHGSRIHFKDGTAHGVTVGPGRGNDLSYYLRFHGHTDARPPRLRLTYEK